MSGPAREVAGEEGFTLVELLVAMTVVVVLMAVTVVAVGNTADLVRVAGRGADLNEQARQALNRMVRDVRQTSELVAAVNPDGPFHDPARVVALRFRADYDGDGCAAGVRVTVGSSACAAYDPANPEDVTYCYDPAAAQLYVVDNQAPSVPVAAAATSCAGGQPLLAGSVAEFRVEYRSSAYRHDVAPGDGTTTWRELDAADPPVGNGNGRLDVELGGVDALVLALVVRRDTGGQTYRTHVDLRNLT